MYIIINLELKNLPQFIHLLIFCDINRGEFYFEQRYSIKYKIKIQKNNCNVLSLVNDSPEFYELSVILIARQQRMLNAPILLIAIKVEASSSLLLV